MRIILVAFLAVIFFSPPPTRAADKNDIRATHSGRLPASGRIVIRSGLAEHNENSPSLRPLIKELAHCLAKKNLRPVAVKPRAMPPLSGTVLSSGAPFAQSSQNSGTPSEEAAQEKAVELARKGTLPQVTLRRYDLRENNAEVSGRGAALVPPPRATGHSAGSGFRETLSVRGFVIPGSLPAELAMDANVADYALIVRFAEVWRQAGLMRRMAQHSGAGGFLVAASSIGGVGSLGFGAPAQPSATQPSTYGTPGGFRRGYEGSAPNDFWNRDHDFYQRDYQFRYGEPPAYASPPSGSASTPGWPGPVPVPSRLRDALPMVATFHLLLLDCYDLAPLRQRGEATLVWQGSAFILASEKKLADSLPALAREIFAR